MKILVTGGAGFIGSHVCDRLLESGYSVVCVDDLNEYYNPKIKRNNIKQNLKNKNFSFLKADISKQKELEKIFEKNKIEKVIHLAARAGVRASIENPEIYVRTNIIGTVNLLELCRKHNVKSFIFGSSSSVYGNNKKVPFSESDNTDNIISPYASTKRAAEFFCKQYSEMYGINIICLRFFTVYGPRGRPDMAPLIFTKAIDSGKIIKMYGNGKTKRDYTFVSDIVEGIISALNYEYKKARFEIINLGDSKTTELIDFISMIEKHLGKKAIIEKNPKQKGDVDITYADISKAKKLLNYNPKVPVEQGLKLLIEWYQKNKKIYD
jgi:UDP-glucuronate 4-epimerase